MYALFCKNQSYDAQVCFGAVLDTEDDAWGFSVKPFLGFQLHKSLKPALEITNSCKRFQKNCCNLRYTENGVGLSKLSAKEERQMRKESKKKTTPSTN